MSHSTAEHMRVAILEASASLREGNHGFGAVIVKDDRVVAQTHDTERTQNDPTAHAEMNAIRQACGNLGKNLEGCALVSTHEPCPMCAGAIVWSGIKRVVYGYGIRDALGQGRRRVDLPCTEVFERAAAGIEVISGVMADACAVLYDAGVRKEIKRLRDATDEQLRAFNEQTAAARVVWFEQNEPLKDVDSSDPLERAYRVLLKRFRIEEDEMPIVKREAGRLVFHSRNFCPTLEACRILGLDTRHVCRLYNEQATDTLVKQVDPHLRFNRNYDRLRPHSECCEEMILM